MNEKVAAIVIAYQPDELFNMRIENIAEQVDKLYIVDNHSNDFFVSYLPIVSGKNSHKITIIANDSNIGVGAALNIGCRHAYENGFQFVVTFDQDSIIEEGFINYLLDTYNTVSVDNKVALVGANLILSKDISFSKQVTFSKFTFKLVAPSNDFEVGFVITSGCLTDLNIWNELGGFREDFFIDYIDTEYSLRCKLNGYKVFVSFSAKLHHELGKKSNHKLLNLPIAATNHNLVRRYYMARNSIHMYKLYAKAFPAWMFFEVYSFIMTYLKIILLEEEKLSKTKMILRGWLDGLKGKTGSFM